MVVRKLSLSEKGKQAIGHIFKDQVPLQDNGVFSVAQIEGIGKIEVFYVDWASLEPEEQEGVLGHIQKQFGGSHDQLQTEIERHGCFPIRSEYIVFSISTRFVTA